MTQVMVTDLGPRNVGKFGPALGTDEAECARKAETTCDDRYSKPATRRYICVDGRLTTELLEMVRAGISPETADAQLAGGIVVSETAARYMDDPSTHEPQSKVVANITKDTIEDGVVVTVHGDTLKGKAGCAAHGGMWDALHFNAENADIVAPTVWSIAKLMGLDGHINEDDVMQSILNGKTAADNKALQDVSVEESAQIMIDNGAEYEELLGEHFERSLRVTLTEDESFSKVDYVRDHNPVEDQSQLTVEDIDDEAFAASLGVYKRDAFERGAKHGVPERETALKVMRVVLFNVGKSKMLLNEEAKVGVRADAN